MKVDQDDIDKIVPELNAVIQLHNAQNPTFPLREFSLNRRVIFLRARKDIREILSDQDIKDDTVAIHYAERGLIYLFRDDIESVIDESGDEINKVLGIGLGSRNKIKFYLLEYLLHENVHRSCQRKKQPKWVSDIYLDFALMLFDEVPNVVCDLETVEKTKGGMRTHGLASSFDHPDGNFHVCGDYMNEFVTNWLSMSAYSNYLETKYPRIQAVLFFIMLMSRHRGLPAEFQDFKNAIKSMHTHPNYDLFMQDYLNGNVHKRVLESNTEEVDGQLSLSHARYDVVLGLLTGYLGCLPSLIESTYGDKDS